MILDDLTDMLEAEGFGTVGENIFYNKMIDEPNNLILVTLLPGFPFSPKIADVKYSVQFISRNTDYDVAYTQINDIAKFFDDGSSRYKVATSGRKMICSITNAPSLITIDESHRALFSVGMYIITSRD